MALKVIRSFVFRGPRGRSPAEGDDADRRGVPAAVHAARLAEGIRQGEALRTAGQPGACRAVATVPAVAMDCGYGRNADDAWGSQGGAGRAARLCEVRGHSADLPRADAGRSAGEECDDGAGQFVTGGCRRRLPSRTTPRAWRG